MCIHLCDIFRTYFKLTFYKHFVFTVKMFILVSVFFFHQLELSEHFVDGIFVRGRHIASTYTHCVSTLKSHTFQFDIDFLLINFMICYKLSKGNTRKMIRNNAKSMSVSVIYYKFTKYLNLHLDPHHQNHHQNPVHNEFVRFVVHPMS